jgi:PhzF family phenazine biosynthesis protein
MKQYVVDAFTDKLFSGNPAAVCILEKKINDELMLNIAMENNLSETAFILNDNGKYNLRWFTPTGEIDFCGHATLASAYVLFNFFDIKEDTITFQTEIDAISVERIDDYYEMTFPKLEYEKVDISVDMVKSFNVKPIEAYMNRDLLLVIHEDDYERIILDFEHMMKLDASCIAISSKCDEYDCISRVFAPRLGISEDPVTGSTHCMISDYWSKRLNKNNIIAYQDSKRGGLLNCTVYDSSIKISGKAVLYSVSLLNID